ncbi:aldehyde ferredoxin oxidoreductase family protein [Desulfovibrio inopinatus]|uniref:aldehyde ferredoxin oxidoreductase family protein n=1 Tax=Desulfovibrio inopinatus TaxID=102109 RepID=UPI0003FEACA3|nr:aldehyde ferredoxin oxidoreductase family protein [Desulfovibrio inopinatus]
MNGWMGTILRVDLGTKNIVTQALDPQYARDYIGGRGFNSYVLFNELPLGIDPLSPDNIFAMAPGVLSGTPLGLTSRLEVSTLSPYSGILGDGNAGESMAFMMKRAGLDQLIVTGRANHPVYLRIHNAKAELYDASDLWGMSTWEVTDILRNRHGKTCSVASIGQAGENLVRFASTMIDKYGSAARGSGAVLGSKNLKAIVVSGDMHVALADEAAFKQLAKEDYKFIKASSFQQDIVAKYGTHIGMMMWEPGFRNSESCMSADDVPEALRPESWKQYETGRVGCHGCHVKCKNRYRIPSGRRAGETGEALEFECIYCLGTNCGILDPIPIMEMENLCDAYGMDVIALGNTIAMAKDLYSRGLLTSAQTGGLSLDWEDADAQVELVHATALRQGFGNLVAEGMYGLAEQLGNTAMELCYHVKGLSRGTYPPGVFALAHATSTRGADHLRGRSWAFNQVDPDIFPVLKEHGLMIENPDADPAPALIVGERITTLSDCTGRCKGGVNNWICAMPLCWKKPIFGGLVDLLTAACGVPYTVEELERAADRIYTLEHAFNICRGVRRRHDSLPQKPELYHSAEGAAERQLHEAHVTRYYQLRGYDEHTGVPTAKRLEELGLDGVAERLKTCQETSNWNGPPLWDEAEYPQGTKRV